MNNFERVDLAIKRTNAEDFEGAMDIFKNGDIVAEHPEAISFYALCVSALFYNHKKALALCINALKRDAKNSVIYRNLGKIFLKVGEKSRAHKAFTRGLKLSNNKDKECFNEISAMGVRRPVAFRALSRNNPVNKAIGKFSSAVPAF